MKAAHSNRITDYTTQIKSTIKLTDPEHVRSELAAKKPLVLIDVREATEWQAGHIPGAIHLTRGLIEWNIEKHVTTDDANLVVYCGSGGRSALVVRNLQEMGYNNVRSMEGGFTLWKSLGYPVE